MALEFKTSGCLVKLYVDQIPLRAEVEDAEKQVAVFTDRQITYGVLGKLPLQALVEKVKKVGPKKIQAVVYQNPKELVFFEAEKAAALLIKKGKEHLREDSEDRFGMYEKALNMLSQALKIQQKLQGDVEDLKGAIFHLTRKLNVLKCQLGAGLYLSGHEVKALKETVEIYQEEESVFETLQTFLEVQDPIEPHHYFLWAVIHEASGDYRLALECYFVLSEDPIRAPACLEKAYQLLQLAANESPDVRIRLDAIRMTFQRHLEGLGKQSPQPKAPECFVCFSLTERDVAHWLEHTLVPDMDHAGIKPIFSFRDLSPGNFLDNFQSLAAHADAAVVVCTPEFKAKYEERKKAPVGAAIEVKIIERRLEDAQKAKTVFPIYLNGDRDQVLPSEYFNQNLATRFGVLTGEDFQFQYFGNTLSLLGAIREVPKEVVREKTESFFNEMRKVLRSEFDPQAVHDWKQTKEQKKTELQASILDRIAQKTQLLNIPRPDKYFTGREKELAELHDKFRHQKRVVVIGLGGVGKTAIALKYANDNASSYQWIHWINGSKGELMIIDLLKLADELHIPRVEKTNVSDPFQKGEDIEMRLRMLKVQLEKLDYEYLLMFDGVDSPEAFQSIQKYLPERGQRVLLTSRMEEEWNRLNFASIKLGLFTEQEAVNFLFIATGTQDEEGAKQLAQVLGYLPLALTHAASYIRMQKGTAGMQEYLKRFEEYELQLFEDEQLRLTNQEKTILKTWRMTMEVIERQNNCLIAKPLMDLIAFLAPSDIPLEALELWSQETKSDKLELYRTLNLLLNYSMLSRPSAPYVVHHLVQMVMRYQLKEEKRQQILDQTVKIFRSLKDRYVIEKIEHQEQIRTLVANCETLLEHFDLYQLNRKKEDLLMILFYLTYCYFHWGQFNKAYKNAEKSLESSKQLYPDLKHREVATSLSYMGSTLRELGRYEEALAYQMEALELCKKVLGPEHPNVGTSLNNLGHTLGEQGRHEEALVYLTEALELRKIALDAEHPDVAQSLNNVGSMLNDLGRHEEALAYKIEALELRKKALGPEHPDVAQSLNNVGYTLGELGRHEEALAYKIEALEIWKRALGPEHPTVAISLNNVGYTFGDLGRHEEALAYQMEALELLKKRLGTEHLDVAISLNNIGGTFGDLGRHKEALAYQREALELLKKGLGTEHPRVTKSLNNMGCTLGELGWHEEALAYQMEALELRKKALGSEHPLVATSLNNVGITLQTLGRYEEALAYQREALELRKKALGPEHPDVAQSLNNVGCTFGDLGRHEEALAYQREALELRKKALGPEHPGVAQSLNNVGITSGDLGRHEEALAYKIEALEIWKRALGPEHPTVAISLNNVGITSGDLGRHEEALAYKIEALEIWKRALGPEHPTVAISLNNVGCTFGDLGRHEEALAYKIEALEIRKRALGPEHPDVAISLNNVGYTLGDLGRHEEAFIYLMEAYELVKKALGPEHPKIMILFQNVLETLKALGQEEKIRTFKEENSILTARLMLSLQNKFLYQEQNETKTSERISHSEREFPTQSLWFDPTSSNNKGVQLINQGRIFEALDFFYQALELQKQHLPKNHPDLVSNLFQISVTQASLHNYPKALQFLKKALQIARSNSDQAMLRLFNAALRQQKEKALYEVRELIPYITYYQTTGEGQKQPNICSELINSLLLEIYDEKYALIALRNLSKSFAKNPQ